MTPGKSSRPAAYRLSETGAFYPVTYRPDNEPRD